MTSLPGSVLSTAVLPSFPPWLFVSDDGLVTGVLNDVMNEMSWRLNISYKLYSPEIDSMDSILDGIAQQVIDLGVAPFVRELDARVGVMFTDTLTDVSHSFLYGRYEQKTTPLALATPFTWGAWILIVSVVLAMGPILYLTLRKSNEFKQKQTELTEKTSGIGNCIWYIYGCAVQQGGTLIPTSLSPRLIIAFWWLFVILVATTYSGNLIASLTIPAKHTHLNTIERLIESNSVKPIVKKDSYLAKYLQTSLNPLHVKLTSHMILVESIDVELLENIKNRKLIYFDTTDELESILQQEFKRTSNCSFAIAQQRFLNLPISLAVVNSSDIGTQISTELRKLAQSGLLQKWKNDYRQATSPCNGHSRSPQSSSTTVDLEDIQGAIYLTLIGWLLALIVAFLERIWKRAKSRATLIKQ